MKKNVEEGSIGFALIMAVAALGVTTALVKQSSVHSQQRLEIAEKQRANEVQAQSDMSSLAIMRSLVNERKTGSGRYEPALFPENYFDLNWKLGKNLEVSSNSVKSAGTKIILKTSSSKELSLANVLPYLGASNSKTFASTINEEKTVEIIGLNRDIENGKPYYIKSMDVRVRSQVAVPGSTATKEQVTTGRIPLEAPKPSNLKFLVKPPGSSTFVEDFGSQSKPWPNGLYTFRVVASGVVHHANVSFNGKSIILGIDSNGVNHEAINVKSTNIVIGDTPTLSLMSNNQANQTVAVAGCHFSVDNDVSAGSTPANFEIKAEVVGVDGQSTSISTSKQLYILPEVVPPTSGGWACQEHCPIRTWEDVLSSDDAFQHYLDISATNPSDKRLTDYLEWDKSVEVHNHNGNGTVCTNFELVAGAIVGSLGQKPSYAAKHNFDEYTRVKDENLGLKRDFAYMAPACERQLVGFRTACGCFEENSLILMADGTERKASQIRAGDRLWNPKAGKAQEVLRVIAGPEEIPLFRVRTSLSAVDVTSEHPFLTTRGLVPANGLKAGDRIISNGAELSVEGVAEVVRGTGDEAPVVWNFELVGSEHPDDHYVLANGIMTGDLYLQIKLKSEAGKP